MIVRPIERKDFPAIFRILRSNGMKPSAPANYFVAELNGLVVGGAGWVPMDQTTFAWLCAVVVDKAYKRRGNRHRSGSRSPQNGRQASLEAMWLETYFWNTRFYKSLLFENIKPVHVPSEVYPWRGNKHCQFMRARANAF